MHLSRLVLADRRDNGRNERRGNGRESLVHEQIPDGNGESPKALRPEQGEPGDDAQGIGHFQGRIQVQAVRNVYGRRFDSVLFGRKRNDKFRRHVRNGRNRHVASRPRRHVLDSRDVRRKSGADLGRRLGRSDGGSRGRRRMTTSSSAYEKRNEGVEIRQFVP